MTAFQPAYDTLTESQRLIEAIEHWQAALPFAGDLLLAHRSAHRSLEESSAVSEAAVEAWRAALARRWECEVAGRRLYKQVLRLYTEHYGDASPKVSLISRGGAEANSSPAELLDDLRRLHAALTVERADLPFADERLPQVDQACAALERAIDEAGATEHRRRVAVLDSRMAREAFRRACEETFGKLSAHYGDKFPPEFQAFLDSASA